jgi:adenosylcobinamide-GDP ribazoletransferase
MRLLRGLKNCIAFLTIIPVGMDRDGINQAATYMPFFPFVGGLIGLIAGSSVWAFNMILPAAIAGILGVGILLLVTGVHHTDGLLDFGDAIMIRGSRPRKLRVLHDNQTGAGAISLGIVVLATTALSLASVSAAAVIQVMVAAEASAKFVLVFLACTGKSACRGMNTPFVVAGHDENRWLRLSASLTFVTILCLLILGLGGILIILSAIATAVVMLGVSTSQLGGITGDVMGATNDLTRMTSLLTIVVASKWL